MAQPKWSPTSVLVDAPTSPEWKFGDKVQCVVTMMGDYASCISALNRPGIGAIGTGDYAGLTVSEVHVQKSRGDVGTLTITFSGPDPNPAAPLPPDVLRIEAKLVWKPVERDPRWASKFTTDAGKSALRAISGLLQAKTLMEQFAVTGWELVLYDELQPLAAANGVTVDTDFAAARDADFNSVYWLRAQGNHVYGRTCPRISITAYSLVPPTLDAGGYIETPPVVGIDAPDGVDFIREADSLEHNGTYWVKTMTWSSDPNAELEVYQEP